MRKLRSFNKVGPAGELHVADTKVVEVDGLRYVYVVESGEIYGEDPEAHDASAAVARRRKLWVAALTCFLTAVIKAMGLSAAAAMRSQWKKVRSSRPAVRRCSGQSSGEDSRRYSMGNDSWS